MRRRAEHAQRRRRRSSTTSATTSATTTRSATTEAATARDEIVGRRELAQRKVAVPQPLPHDVARPPRSDVPARPRAAAADGRPALPRLEPLARRAHHHAARWRRCDHRPLEVCRRGEPRGAPGARAARLADGADVQLRDARCAAQLSRALGVAPPRGAVPLRTRGPTGIPRRLREGPGAPPRPRPRGSLRPTLVPRLRTRCPSGRRRRTPRDSPSPPPAAILSGGAKFIGASAGRLAIVKFLASLNPSADVLALANLEVDISNLQEGDCMTVKWRGKPVFVRARTGAPPRPRDPPRSRRRSPAVSAPHRRPPLAPPLRPQTPRSRRPITSRCPISATPRPTPTAA